MREALIVISFLVLNISPSFSSQRGIQVKAVTRDGQSINLYSNSYALVVGVSDYTNGWPDLPNAANDAREVGLELKKHGFEVYSLDNPTSTQLKNGIETFIASYGLNPDSRLILFYAGHGHTIKKSYGGNVGYIVPADAPDPGLDMAGFVRKAISMERFNTYARDINAKHVLYLFDSCFSGSIFALSRAVPEAISYKTSRHVRQFITAGSEDEHVPDRSVFKSQLISAIQGEADKDQDGYVTGTELGMFLQDRVVNYTRGSQHPQYGKIRDPQLDKGDFVFVIGTLPPTPVVIPDPPEDKPGVDISRYEVERDRLTTAKKQWSDWQSKMNNDFDKINDLDSDENLTAASKSKLWGDFLSTYVDNNPYSNEDDNLRSKARSWKDYWTTELPNFRRRYPQYDDWSDAKILYGIRNKYPKYKDWSDLKMKYALENKYPEEPRLDIEQDLMAPRPMTELDVERQQWGYGPGYIPNGMVFVPGGSFMMGSNEGDDDEKPIHLVYVDGFYMDKYEVTVAQFKEFCNETGHKMPVLPTWNKDNHPVVNVTWHDAAVYAEWAGKRLPTEAEWEYAAREGGKDVLFGNGKDIADPGEMNFDGRSQYKVRYSVSGVYRQRTTPVGSFASNALGLYDMSGNVVEWCADWYVKNYYDNSPERNPQGPSSIYFRVLRGGSWCNRPYSLGCARRGKMFPDFCLNFYGFRCVRTL